jgi:hypothetical protein
MKAEAKLTYLRNVIILAARNHVWKSMRLKATNVNHSFVGFFFLHNPLTMLPVLAGLDERDFWSYFFVMSLSA